MSLRPAAGKSKPCPPKPGGVVEAKVRKPLERKPLKAREPAPGQPARTSTLARRSKPTSRTGYRMTPEQREAALAWRMAAVADSGGRDAVTGEPLLADFQVHHVTPQTTLWAMRRRLHLSIDELQDLLWDRRNGMALNRRTHEQHESGHQSIPRTALRPHHWEFARHLDELAGTEWATARLEQAYPEGK